MASSSQKISTVKDNYDYDRLKLIFDYSPIAIWEEDFSALANLKSYLEKYKVEDYRKYLFDHPKLVKDTFRKLKIVDVNLAAVKLYGAKTKAQLIDNLGKVVHKSALNTLVEEFSALLNGNDTFETEFKSRTLTGRLYDVRLKVSVPEVYKNSWKRVIVTLQDISVQKRYERHLKQLAQTDGLTNVLNHSAIRYRLEEEVARAKRYRLDLSCMMIDMDNFKQVNDKYGHQKGDAVLKKTAALIKSHLREVDIVGRYGGDEFMVILPETNKVNAITAAERIQKLFFELVHDESIRMPFCTLSIGVGGRPDTDVETAKDLITKIDKGMYEAKKTGKNKVSLI
ncbi:MAG: GGDEF domain-containing protein [Candidatus Omnitrophica bacterium]|nr:GGDEF domain-containing protein [Candidatus Omnitrophota bacterium]